MLRIASMALATVALLAPIAEGATGTAPGLPQVASGARPGPDALYAPPADAPQLRNAAPWKAAPILVSGTEAYRGGEWLYQDFLNDDHGAAGGADPDDPHGVGAYLFSPTTGGVTYPTADVYAHNAADLVELRIRPLADATAFRVTLNTLIDPARTAFTIALGSSPAALPWPHGAGVSSPAQLFLTVHGATAELVDATTSAKAGTPTAGVDAERRQVDVRVPHAAWNPGGDKVRVEIGVGLWDAAADAYLAPKPGAATEDTPGGASPAGAALFNVGPRFDEPTPKVASPGGNTLVDAAAGAKADAPWWREKSQGTALATGDISAFAAEVDFAKLAAGVTDDSKIPTTGSISRILASRVQFGQGEDPERVCFDLAGDFSAGAKCEGRMIGQLQPYVLYVPQKPQPAGGWGMTLLLHSLSANYNQYATSRNQSELGERGRGSLVITPSGRGPDGFYGGYAEADTFETWADVARRYKLDPDWVVSTGYSMGGFGTYRLLARWPDLFARGFSTVGAPGSAEDQLASLRNTPLLAWNGDRDELVNIQTSEAAVAAMTAAGLRFTEDLFLNTSHLTLATNDEYTPAAEWLGEHTVDRNPSHVTYVVDPTEDSFPAGAVADHAYWASGMKVRDAKKAPIATFEARSDAFGVGDPMPTGVEEGAGTLTGGEKGPLAYRERTQDWTAAPSIAKADVLHVKATNLASVVVDARRAGLTCSPQLDIVSDGPLDLQLDCPAVATPKGCAKRVSVRLPRVRGRRITRVIVTRRGKRAHGHRIKSVRGRNLRRIVVRRPSKRAFSLRLHLHATGKGGKVRKVVVTRRFKRCGAA